MRTPRRPCLFCDRPMGRGTDEHGFPVVRVAAYDAQRHRLWAVCDRCRRWNLWPLEDRSEVIEGMERLARDRGTPVASTQNITLLRADEAALVRVGDAGLAEKSWWRYGRELQRRRVWNQSPTFQIAGYVQGSLTVLAQSIGLADEDRKVTWDQGGLVDVLRWRRFGRAAWRGRLPCRNCGSVRRALLYDTGCFAHPVVSQAGLELRIPCPRCDFWDPEDGFRMTGPNAEATLRRLLAYHHYDGADDTSIDRAVDRIEQTGGMHALIPYQERPSRSLWSMEQSDVLALDILINEAAERRVLQNLAREYDSIWKREEELAEIIDAELTW